MIKIDRGLHLIVFLFFFAGLVFSTIRIINSIKFIVFKKTSEALIFLKSVDVNDENKNRIGISFWDENINANRKVKLIVDPLKYKELASVKQVYISYGKGSEDVYLIGYNEPNLGQLVVFLIGWVLAFYLIIIYLKKIVHIIKNHLSKPI